MGGEAWTHSVTWGTKAAQNLVGKCDSLFSSSAFRRLQTPATGLPRKSSCPPLSSFLFLHTYTSPLFLLSHYSLHLHSSALLSNQHRYNYTDAVELNYHRSLHRCIWFFKSNVILQTDQEVNWLR